MPFYTKPAIFIAIHGMLMRSLPIVLCMAFAFFCCADMTAQKKIKGVTPHPPAIVKTEIISFDILENGDSINRMDNHEKKQGPWLTIQKEIRGEDGFTEYGEYVDDRKVGKWYRLTMSGKPVAVENYKSGKLNGEATYYEEGRLICVGNYYALHDANSIDTFMVEDPGTNKIYPVYIQSSVGSVRHGLWTYYDGDTQQPYRKVEYQADKVVFDKQLLTTRDSAFLQRQEARHKTLPSKENNESIWMLDKKSKAAEYIGLPTRQHYRKPGY